MLKVPTVPTFKNPPLTPGHSAAQLQNELARSAWLRLTHIIGNPKADPPVPPLIPIGKSTWWQWIRDGKAPAPVKLGPRTTAWKSSDISALIESLNATKTGGQ